MGRTAHHAAAFDLSLSLSLSFACSLVVSLLHRASLVARCVGVAWCLSSVSLLRVLLVFNSIISLIGGSGGFGRHWRPSLVAESSLD